MNDKGWIRGLVSQEIFLKPECAKGVRAKGKQERWERKRAKNCKGSEGEVFRGTRLAPAQEQDERQIPTAISVAVAFPCNTSATLFANHSHPMRLKYLV